MTRLRFGPGLLVTAAFIGPGTLVTASRAGAGYGVTLLWAVLFSVAATGILQDMAARVGLAGRCGLAEAIRDSLSNRWLQVGALGLITGTILVGTAAFQTGNLLGAALGLNLLSGLPTAALAISVGGLAAGVLMTGTYQTIQNTLVGLVGLMSLVFCAVAVLTAPDLGDLITGILIPRIPPGSLLTVLALIGTTFVSYNLFLHASTVLEYWPDADRNDENLRESRRDTVFAVALGGLITAAVIVASAPLLGQGADACQRRRGCRPAGPDPRAHRASLLWSRALRRRADLGNHRPARRRVCGQRRARMAAGLAERPVPAALGPRARDRRGLRCHARQRSLPGHPAGAGGERHRAPADADPAAHCRQQDRDHGAPPQLAACQCPGRNRRASDLGAVADATGPGAGACRIVTNVSRLCSIRFQVISGLVLPLAILGCDPPSEVNPFRIGV